MNEASSLDLYKKLYLVRRSEDYIVKHYPENEMKCPMHMSMGQEAISVGVCSALNLSDQVFASYRSHAAFLSKTGDLDAFFGEIYGKVTGLAHGKSGSMHLSHPSLGFMGSSGVVGSNIPVAVGAAYANKYKKNGLVACVFMGDGALDEGVFWESFNMACLKGLPVLFVVEDNGYAVDTPVHVRQGFRDIVDVACQFRCYRLSLSTTDVVLIHNITIGAREMIEEAKMPALLHFKCCRYLEHVGIHEDTLMDGNSYSKWLARDCVKLQRNRLLILGHKESAIETIESMIDSQIETCAERAREAPYTEPEDLYRGVFYRGGHAF